MSPQHKLMPCIECDGTGDAEYIQGWARPCECCNGTGETSPTTDVSTDGLVERLRDADRGSVQRSLGSRIFGEAADRIEALQRSNAEKDEALLDIHNRILCPVGPSPTLDEIAQIASKALSHSSETSNDG